MILVSGKKLLEPLQEDLRRGNGVRRNRPAKRLRNARPTHRFGRIPQMVRAENCRPLAGDSGLRTLWTISQIGGRAARSWRKSAERVILFRPLPATEETLHMIGRRNFMMKPECCIVTRPGLCCGRARR